MNQEATIATLSVSCQTHFEEFIDALEATSTRMRTERNESRYELSRTAVEDELDRFRLWANNIGAAKIGRASLDYRLRDAEYLFRNVKSLLVDLERSLSQGLFGL